MSFSVTRWLFASHCRSASAALELRSFRSTVEFSENTIKPKPIRAITLPGAPFVSFAFSPAPSISRLLFPLTPRMNK